MILTAYYCKKCDKKFLWYFPRDKPECLDCGAKQVKKINVKEYSCLNCKKLFLKDPEEKCTCPFCNSDKKIRESRSGNPTIIFKEPKGTSKEDNLEYVYRTNLENAKKHRWMAEQKYKQLGLETPYQESTPTDGDYREVIDVD